MRIIYFIDCAGIPFVVQSHETVFRHNFYNEMKHGNIINEV